MTRKLVRRSAGGGEGWLASGAPLTNNVYGGVCKRCGKPWASICPGKKYCGPTCQSAAQHERAKKKKAKAKAKK